MENKQDSYIYDDVQSQDYETNVTVQILYFYWYLSIIKPENHPPEVHSMIPGDYWIYVNITATSSVLTLNQFLTLHVYNVVKA